MIKYQLSGPYGKVSLSIVPYVGKYSGNLLMELMMPNAMAKFSDWALARISKELGMSSDEMTLQIEWTDIEKEFATTFTDRTNGVVQTVIFSAPHYMKMYGLVTNIWQEFLHELTHAVQRHTMGMNYDTVPRWWREGCALYVARPQGDVRVFNHYVVASYPTERLITNLMIPDDEFGPVNYPESYLALVYLRTKWGEKIIRTINRNLNSGKMTNGFVSVLEEQTGMSMETFGVNAGAFALDKMKKWNFLRRKVN